jgi:hypothetical protein
MKPLFTLLLFLSAISALGQPLSKDFYVTFDTLDTTVLKYTIAVDTADTTNRWQIGVPHKTVFNSGYGGPVAILTDTASPCVPYDTSVLTVSFPPAINTLEGTYIFQSLTYWQMLNMDTGDIAIVTKDNISSAWDTVKKDTISTVGWKKVTHMSFSLWGYPPPVFHFLFITDSSTQNRDGWMLDSLHLVYIRFTGVDDVPAANVISLYPNPAQNDITIQLPDGIELIQIRLQDVQGRMLMTYADTKKLNISSLPAGLYLLQVETDKGRFVRRFVKE